MIQEANKSLEDEESFESYENEGKYWKIPFDARQQGGAQDSCYIWWFIDAERVVEEGEYELPDDIYDTQGLFDDEDEGKQDDEGLLHNYDLWSFH